MFALLRRFYPLIIGIWVVLIVTVVWLHRLEQQEWYATSAGAVPQAMRVELVAIDQGPVTHWIVAEGYAQAVRRTHLQFEGAGKVVALGAGNGDVPLREGDRVLGPDASAPGDFLARIDSRDSEADLTSQRGTLSEARQEQAEAARDFERMQALLSQGHIARSRFDQAATRLEKARAQVEIARAALAKAQRGPERMTLRAPFDGIIARLNIKEGDYFDPASVNHAGEAQLEATAPITIIDPTEMEVVLHLHEFDGKTVRQGQRVVVTPSSETWPQGMTMENAPQAVGIVHSVSPGMDRTRRAIRVTVRLQQHDLAIADGLFTSCWIAAEEKTGVVRVPLGAIMHQGSQQFVFVNRDGEAQKQVIKLGVRNTRYAEVIEGLSSGDEVICKGRFKLAEGTLIASVKHNETATVQ